MTRYLLQRSLLMIPTFIGITLIVFLIVRLAPGDPAELRAAGGLGAAVYLWRQDDASPVAPKETPVALQEPKSPVAPKDA